MTEHARQGPLHLFRTVDARDWEPPRPFETMVQTLDELPAGSKVVMLLHCEPHPLFRFLRSNGFDYRCRFQPDGHFEVTVWHSSDTQASSAELE